MVDKIIKTAAPFILVFILCVCFIPAIPVYADTDGNELRSTNQPDKLVLELGTNWSGAEFELRLDSGVFPVPVAANTSGTLTMDLGGSKTYTLKLLTPAAVAAEPPVKKEDPQIEQPVQTEKPTPTKEPAPTEEPASAINIEQPGSDAPVVTATPGADPYIPEATREINSIPPLPLILFLVGLIAAVSGLIIMRVIKKRREEYDDDSDYGYDDETE